jgi:hypothetical protein
MSTATLGPSGRTAPPAAISGWTGFAAAVLLVAGGLNLINGFTALQHSSYYSHHLVYTNLTFWGWAFIAWGVAQVVAGGLVFARHTAGLAIGAVLAGTAAVLWFFMIFSAPWAAVVGVTVSLLVLYGLTAGAMTEEY